MPAEPYTAAMHSSSCRLVVVPVCLGLAAMGHAADVPDSAVEGFRKCAALVGADVRLACFDELAIQFDVPVKSLAQAEKPNATDDDTDDAPVSRLSRRWQLEDISQRGRFALVAHKPNYLLPATWNFEPNQAPFADRGVEVPNEEAKLQLSFKVKLAQGIFGDNGDLWATYTQQSFWMVYAKSSPFRDTNYEPSLMFTWRTRLPVFGGQVRLLGVELNHESNGRGDGEGLSRSWNRVIGKAVWENGDWVAEARAWWRIPEPLSTDNNPDIEDYLGHSDFTLSWARGMNTLTAQLGARFTTDQPRGSAELTWSFPLRRSVNLRGYVQYFNGYGETLIDYNARTHRIGVGLAFSDWY